jgi:hypothetical protein
LTIDTDLFVTVAEIAGIFVGFGALIGITRRTSIETSTLWRIRGLVTIGLGVIVGALIPIGLSRYDISGHDLWLICAATYFALNLAFSIWSLRKPEVRKLVITEVGANPVMGLFFWLLLEIPLQVPLILIMLGVSPDLDPAFYTTALFFSLFEAAFILAQFVYSQVPKKKQ